MTIVTFSLVRFIHLTLSHWDIESYCVKFIYRLDNFIFYSPLCESFESIKGDNNTNMTVDVPNITKQFCQNVNLSDREMLIYRYTLVLVQYIIPVCVISFVYIQV